MPSPASMSTRALLGTWLLALAACAPADARLEAGPLASAVYRCPALPETIELGDVPAGGVGTYRLSGIGLEVQLEATGAFTARREDAEVVVEVHPAIAERLEGTLTARAPRCATASSHLLAQGMPRCLEVTPSLRFADAQRTCGSATATMDVHNRCDVDVALHGGNVVEPDDGADAWCAGGAPCQEFGVVGGTSVIAPGSSSTLSLRFSPANTGERIGDLRLASEERSGVAEYLVAVSGTGLPRATMTQSFDAPDLTVRGDLLLILDASTSMRARSEMNSANFASFAKYLVASQMDVRVTVASAERTLAGTTVGSANARDTDFETTFSQLLAAVPPGTDDTSCMEQALAMTRASPSFRRPGVRLAIVCVTDGPDHATSAWQPMMSEMATRTDTPMAMIVGPFVSVAGCSSELDDGRLALWANNTNGIREEICTPSWAKALESLSVSSFGYFYEIFLPQPALRIVRLEIDGVELSANSGGWDWDTAANAIIFNPLFVPQPGSVVSLTWESPCP